MSSCLLPKDKLLEKHTHVKFKGTTYCIHTAKNSLTLTRKPQELMMTSRTDKTTDLYKQEEKNAKKKSFRPTFAILFLLGFNIIWITEKYCIGKYALNLRKGGSELVSDPIVLLR